MANLQYLQILQSNQEQIQDLQKEILKLQEGLHEVKTNTNLDRLRLRNVEDQVKSDSCRVDQLNLKVSNIENNDRSISSGNRSGLDDDNEYDKEEETHFDTRHLRGRDVIKQEPGTKRYSKNFYKIMEIREKARNKKREARQRMKRELSAAEWEHHRMVNRERMRQTRAKRLQTLSPEELAIIKRKQRDRARERRSRLKEGLSPEEIQEIENKNKNRRRGNDVFGEGEEFQRLPSPEELEALQSKDDRRIRDAIERRKLLEIIEEEDPEEEENIMPGLFGKG